MLLLITGSRDGTSDLIVSKLGSGNVFRFNYDLFNDYSLHFSPHYWKIENPAGLTIDTASISAAFWWKAFNFYLQNHDDFIVEEVKYIFREIYHFCRLKGIVKGNSHDFHNHLGKMNLLNLASQYFCIPQTLATFKLSGLYTLQHKEIVAKSFSSGLTTTNKSLMTTMVKSENLHPDFPWYLQELIRSESDITVFICGQRYFAFERSRKNLHGVDWRSNQSFQEYKKEWFAFELTIKDKLNIKNFCNSIKVDWGRIDFMRNTSGELVFLEFNANGQWVFLDYENEYGLIDAVVEYLTK